MVRNLRNRVFGHSKFAACGICESIDLKEYFDVDHKIPQCVGGPDDSWNLWPLCLKHHRQKCLAEIDWIRSLGPSEKRCFSCNIVFSRHFLDGFWCAKCSVLPIVTLSLNLESIIKNLNCVNDLIILSP